MSAGSFVGMSGLTSAAIKIGIKATGVTISAAGAPAVIIGVGVAIGVVVISAGIYAYFNAKAEKPKRAVMKLA